MKLIHLLSSLIYSLVQIAQGLLLHPYQTMQNLVIEKIFIWTSFLPAFVLIFLITLWRLIAHALFYPYLPPPLWQFLADWVFFFCFYWQALLLYLLARFVTVYYHQ